MVDRARDVQRKRAREPTCPFLRRGVDLYVSYGRSVIALPEYRSKIDMTSYVRSMTTIPEEDGVSEATEQGVCRKKSPFKEMCDTLQKMLDLSLLKDPAFCLYNVACFLCMSGRSRDTIAMGTTFVVAQHMRATHRGPF